MSKIMKKMQVVAGFLVLLFLGIFFTQNSCFAALSFAGADLNVGVNPPSAAFFNVRVDLSGTGTATSGIAIIVDQNSGRDVTAPISCDGNACFGSGGVFGVDDGSVWYINHVSIGVLNSNSINISGNLSNSVVINFPIIPPHVNEVEPVPSPTNNNTPSYTFYTDTAGGLGYSGDCRSDTGTTHVGNNTIIFNTLSDGVHSNCKIIVLERASTQIDVSTFTIDTTGPTLTGVTQVPSPTADNTLEYTFQSSEDVSGHIAYSGACGTPVAENEIEGMPQGGGDPIFRYDITYDTLNDGIYDDCTIVAQDGLGNTSNTLTVNTFTVDTTPPTLTQITPVLAMTYDTTPTYVFNSTEAGTIHYVGDCSSSDASAIAGDNEITFNKLASGIHSNCTIIVEDSSHNLSEALNVSSFTVDDEVVVTSLTPGQIAQDIESGAISFEGDDSDKTQMITFNVDYAIETNNFNINIPAGTEMTQVEGQEFDLATLISEQFVIDGAAGALKFGVPNARMKFSEPITISINVGSQYDGRTLTVYYQHDGETVWNQETTCQVASGICAFTTTHATYFAAGEGIPGKKKEIKKDDDKKGTKAERKKYKHYKGLYRNKISKTIYSEIRQVRRTNKTLLEQYKSIYVAHRKDKKEDIEKLDVKTKQIFFKYKNYNGYRNYKLYGERVGK